MPDISKDDVAKIEEAAKYHNPKKTRVREAADEEKEPVIPVVEGKVIRRKKSFGDRVRSFFGSEDTKSVGGYVFAEVILPAFRDLLFDSINAGAAKAIYNDDRIVPARGGRRAPGSMRTPYHQVSSGSSRVTRREATEDRRAELSRKARARHDFSDVVLESRTDAEEVIDGMLRLLDRFQMVTVADLYDLLGVDSEFVDQKWGWTNLEGVYAKGVRGGYLLVLPETEQLD